ncbi:MAG: ABC transporter ATP-binding protein [Clostridia bacterium]|nr:ABC transporter ATP-binding protein [Clostridia bacterium]
MPKVNTYSQDEDLKVSLNKSHLQKAKTYLLKYKKEFILTLIVLLISTVANMALPYIVQIALDDMIPSANIRGLFTLGGICLVIMIISIFATRFRMKYMNYVGHSVIYDLRKDLFAHLQKLPFTYFDSRPHGKILVRVVNYVNSLADMFSNGIVNAIMEMVSLFVIVGFMFAIDVRLAAISLIGFPLLVFFIVKLRSIHRKAWQSYSDKNSNLNAYLAESINGVRITQAFVRERKNSRIFSRISGDTMRAWIRAKCIEFLIWPTSSVISELSVCVIYFIGAAMVSKAQLSVGVIVAIISYIWRFWGPINNMSNIYNSVITNAAYLERILETMEEDVEIEDKPDAKEMPDVKGKVEFKHVTFGYDEHCHILEDLNFTVEPGQTIALVGHTGAGKTTVVNLLSRYYNLNSGEICIDGINIADVTIKSLREQFGYMLQDSFMFSGTIMENIRYGRLDATDEEVMEAAKVVNAHDFITKLPAGYNTFVSERGGTLSAGQQQLISLARAMLKDPHILILDEATSSIDTETEIKLIDGINRLLEGRTSFVIAHRLSTIKAADRIMVIGNQNIIEQGTHEELLALQGEYYKLYQAQTSL